MIRNRRLPVLTFTVLLVASTATIGVAFGGIAASESNGVLTDAETAMQATQANGTQTDSNAGWGVPRADAGHTGYTSDDGPGPYANTSWAQASQGRSQITPIVVDDTVIMPYAGDGTPNGMVEAYDETTGEKDWIQENVGEPTGPATTANGTIFVATVDSGLFEYPPSAYENRTGLYALGAANGTIEWRVNDSFSAPVVANGVVFASERPVQFDVDERHYGNVTALDAATGDRIWMSDVDGKVLAHADGRLVVGNESTETLTALDATDGTVRWQTTVDEAVEVQDSIAATADTLYATAVGNDGTTNVVAFAADSGETEWQARLQSGANFSTDPGSPSAPAVTNGSVYVVTNNANSATYQPSGIVHALDADDGDTRWRFHTRATLRGAPAVANGTVHAVGMYEFQEAWLSERNTSEAAEWRVPGSWPAVYALDATNGSERWTLLTDTAANDNGPYGTAVADGRVYFATTEFGTPGATRITAVESTDDRPAWYFHPVEDQDFETPNLEPEADIDASVPEDGVTYEPNTTVTLDGSASSEPNGEVVAYEWDVDDDGEFEKTGSSIQVTTAEEACARMTVTLRVTDDDGQTDVTTTTLQNEPEGE